MDPRVTASAYLEAARPGPVLTAALALALALAALPAFAADRGAESKEEYRDGPCTVVHEVKRDGYKYERECKDSHGADWGGTYVREFRDRGCRVKIDASREKYVEEVDCDD